MEVDVHKIMTTLFNVELNEFMAKFWKYRTFETVITGGLMEIMLRNVHQFYVYALWLNEFREQLYQKSANFKMEFETFQNELESLLEFYVNLKLLAEYHVFCKDDEKDLNEYLLKPFMHFISKLDETFGSVHLVSRINKLMNEALAVTVRVFNALRIPVINVEVKFSYVRFPEFGIYAKTYPLCVLKTNDEGIASIRLLRPREGSYRIDVEKYNKIEFFDVKSGNCIEIKVRDFIHLVRYGVSKLKLTK